MDEGLRFEAGEISRLCWQLYKERSKKEKPTYNINFIPFEELCSPETIQLLKNELQYLKNLK